jgi:hypothetical protein
MLAVVNLKFNRQIAMIIKARRRKYRKPNGYRRPFIYIYFSKIQIYTQYFISNCDENTNSEVIDGRTILNAFL